MATAHSEIATLLKLERFYRDAGRFDLCRATFHPNAAATYINVAWYEGNVDDFMRASTKAWQGKVNILHSSFDPVNIQIRGNRATSEAFCLITSLLTLDGADYELASYIRLVSRLEKLPETGEWRILTLEAMYVRDRFVAAYPGTVSSLPPVLPEDILAYPKPYRHLAFVMKQRGLKPRPGLPHEEDQPSVQKVLDANSAWLENGEEGASQA